MSTPSLVFLGIWFVILLLLWVAGSPALTSANEQIEESD
jgi:hypothetical protein